MRNIIKLVSCSVALILVASGSLASNGRRYFNYEFLVYAGRNATVVTRYAHGVTDAEIVRGELSQGETNPIDGASIDVDYYIGENNTTSFVSLRTNADGRAAFSDQLAPGTQPGRYHIKVSKPGYITYEFDMQNQDPDINTYNTMFNKVILREAPPDIWKRLRSITKIRIGR